MLQIDKANRTAIPLALKTCLYNRQMKNNTSHQLFHIDFVCFPSIKPTDSIMPTWEHTGHVATRSALPSNLPLAALDGLQRLQGR